MLRYFLIFTLFATTFPLEASERRHARSPVVSQISAPVAGPVEADLVRVIDGDTLLVNAHPWPQHAISVLVRIRGIDAPELKSRCPAARQTAKRARDELARLATGAIRLSNISGDKYFGRVVADVSAESSGDVAAAMLGSGLARSYDGGRRSETSCRTPLAASN
jgi:micrococcal nuclease